MGFNAVFELDDPLVLVPREPQAEGAMNIAWTIRNQIKNPETSKFGTIRAEDIVAGLTSPLKDFPWIDVEWLTTETGLDPVKGGDAPDSEAGRRRSETWVLRYAVNYYNGILGATANDLEATEAIGRLLLILDHFYTFKGFAENSRVMNAGKAKQTFVDKSVQTPDGAVGLMEVLGGSIFVEIRHEWKLLTREDGGQTPRLAINPTGPKF